MKSVAAVAAAAAAALYAVGVAAQSSSCTINTPTNVAECIPIQFAWSGGTPPYYLSIEPGNDPSAAALQLYGPLNGDTLTWSSNITQGTNLGLTLRDANGISCQSGPFTVNPGSTSCLSASGSSAASGASSTAPAASSTGSAATSAAHSSASSALSSASSAASSASSAAASATHTSGAGMNVGSLSVAAVVAAFVAAALA